MLVESNTEKRLEEVERLVKENNHMLHKLCRGQMWASLMRVLYWLIALGIAGATYIWLKPYLEALVKTYADLSGLFK